MSVCLFARSAPILASLPLRCLHRQACCCARAYANTAPVGGSADCDGATTSIDIFDTGNDFGDKGAHLTALFGKKQHLAPGLYLVATPIGNLEDVTIRALRVLSEADAVFAEDCRRTHTLLNAYGIRAQSLRSYHMHNEAQRTPEVVRLVQQGQVVALVSDAGTPGVSDPGSVAVAAVVAAGLRVVPIPGPAAAISALVASGLPTLEFHFVGFLPAKASARRRQLQSLRKHVAVRCHATDLFAAVGQLAFGVCAAESATV